MSRSSFVLLRAFALSVFAFFNSVVCANAQAPKGIASEVAEYRLGPGDTVSVKVFQEADLTGEYFVGPNGEISMPLAGSIQVAGLTTTELAAAVADRLSNGYIDDANVVAEIAKFRPYYIFGEVEDAGEYPYSAGLTISRAVATAGGYTYRAKKSFVYIQRAGSDKEEKVKVTFSSRIYPGDVVRVPERFF